MAVYRQIKFGQIKARTSGSCFDRDVDRDLIENVFDREETEISKEWQGCSG